MDTAPPLNGNAPESRQQSVEPGPHQSGGGTHPAPANRPASPASQKVRILVVENDSFVRGGIVRLINAQADLACCGEAGSIAATPAAIASQEPNLVLLDLKLEDGEAFELISMLGKRFPHVPILVLSQLDEKLHAGRVLQAGAKGYIMKEAATDNLLDAIRMVMDGKIYLSPAMTARLLQEVQPQHFRHPSECSPERRNHITP